MKKNNLKFWVACLLLFTGSMVQGQNVSISEDELYTPDPSAILEIYSPNKGLLIPRLALITTNNPITSATKPTGLMVWNTSTSGNYPTPGFYFWDGTDWKMVGATSFAFQNGITRTGSNIKLGGSLTENTTLTQGTYNMIFNLTSTGDFDIQDNGSPAFYVRDDGFVGIGTNAPLHKLHVYGDNSNVAGTDGMFIDIQNTNNTTGVLSGIRFQNGTPASTFKGGIFFRDSASLGRGDLIFANNTSGAAGNVTAADAKMVIKSAGNIGIGTSVPNASALLEMASTTSGVLVPRMDSSERNAIATPTNGLLVYDTFYGSFFYYNSTKGKWVNLGAKNSGAQPNEALFAVVNNAGDTVFAVYQEGVRINVGDGITGTKGTTKGGFAVSGVSTGKGIKQDYFIINQDSARIYVEEGSGGKGTTKGGFAVSGVSTGKGIGNEILRVTEDSVRVYFNTEGGKGTTKGGFAVSGVSSGKGTEQDYFLINQDSARIYVEEAAKGTTKGGFAVSGISTGKGGSNDIMKVTKDSTRLYVADPNAGFSIGNTESGPTTSLMQLLKQNYFIGHEAGVNIESGLYNSFIGFEAGKATTTGSYNIFLGHQTGNNNTGGSNNVFLGYKAGLDNTVGINNVFVGYQTGQMNISGENNVAIGFTAGNSNKTGNFNTALGYEAGLSNLHSDNTFIGYRAGKSHITGGGNIFLGSKAGELDTAGIQNIFIGEGSGLHNETGQHNVYVGHECGQNNTTGGKNVFLGYNGGYNNTAGSRNVFLGYLSGYNNTSGYSNVFLGDNAGYTNTSGYYNVFLGYRAGRLADLAYYNTFVGAESGENTINGSNPIQQGKFNSFFGTQAGQSNTTGYYNSFFGNGSGWNSTTGARNTFLGNNAGYQNQGGNENTFVGNAAGRTHRNGDYNTYIGTYAGYSSYTGATRNIAIGAQGGSGNAFDGLTGSDNISLGSGSADSLSTGSRNINIGFSAGKTLTIQNNNIFIGHQAGETSKASNNIFIGYQANAATATHSNIVAIGNGVSATASNQVRLGNASTATLFCQGAYEATTALAPNLHVADNGQIMRSSVSMASGSGAASKLAFWSDANTLTSSSYLHWDNTDNQLGVGVLSPAYTLHVASTGAKTALFIGSYFINTATSSTASITKTGLSINSTGAWTGTSAINRGLYVNVSGGTNNYAAIFNGGYVGIGSLTPEGLLHLNSDGDALSIIEADADNATETDNPRLEFRQDGNTVVGGIGFEGTAGALYTNSLANAMYLVNNYASSTLQLGTNGTANMTIATTGNVGIGINAPDYALHIYDDVFSKIKIENSGTSYTGYIGNDVSGTFLSTNAYYNGSWNYDVSTEPSLILAQHVGNDQFEFRVRPASGTFATAMVIETSGLVGIGTTAPSEALHVVGNARFTAVASGAYDAPLNITSTGVLTRLTSDRRLKENFKPIENGLEKILKLQGTYFTWKSDSTHSQKIGFIAQEVEEVLPELVFTNPTDGYKGINYAEITAVLTEAIKEQQKQIESLKVENTALKTQQANYEELKAEIEKIKAGMQLK